MTTTKKEKHDWAPLLFALASSCLAFAVASAVEGSSGLAGNASWIGIYLFAAGLNQLVSRIVNALDRQAETEKLKREVAAFRHCSCGAARAFTDPVTAIHALDCSARSK